MLETLLNLDTIFSAARSHGFLSTEIYLECSFHNDAQIADRITHSQLAFTGGLSVRFQKDGRFYHTATSEISTGSLLDLLSHLSSNPIAPPVQAYMQGLTPKITREFHSRIAAPHRKNIYERLSQISRHIELASKISWLEMGYQDRITCFERIVDGGALSAGEEEEASCVIRWKSPLAAQPLSLQLIQSTPDTLFCALESPDIIANVINSLQKIAYWPVPKGEIPILWSHQALARLLLPFVRAFEGDRVLEHSSFLTQVNLPLDLGFALIDNPNSARGNVDHEGAPIGTFCFFDSVKPRGLACNLEIASELQVQSTGHCRRPSFTAKPTVGFWNVHLEPKTTRENLLAELEKGIWVEDAHVLEAKNQPGQLDIRVTRGYLVHHGEVGEAIHPFHFQIDVATLLKSLSCFDTHKRSIGFPIQKSGSRFVTELSIPRALSEGIYIPGDVPMANYW